MSNIFVFADEAGDFSFKRAVGASRYFILCTVTAVDAGLSHDLLQIRRELILSGEGDRDCLLHGCLSWVVTPASSSPWVAVVSAPEGCSPRIEGWASLRRPEAAAPRGPARPPSRRSSILGWNPFWLPQTTNS